MVNKEKGRSFTLTIIRTIPHCLKNSSVYPSKYYIFVIGGGGGSNPSFAHGKNVSFPIFPHGEKSIWKKREKYSFPSLSIYFFPMGKSGKRHNFPMGKNGVGPPPPPPYWCVTAV